MALNTLQLIFIIGSIIIWLLISIVIFKLYCDRNKELKMIRDIKHELTIVKQEVKYFKETS